MICSELLRSDLRPIPINFSSYFDLYPQERALIYGWFQRAWDKRDCQGDESFEAFSYAWFAFNGWSACVTDLDEDYKYIDALKRDPRLCHKFSDLAAPFDSLFRQYTTQFALQWPIFDVRFLPRLNINFPHRASRSAVVDYYLSRGVDKFEPRCWKAHKEARKPIPVDWPHTLAALYKVRCNLFHGRKSARSEMDQQIVSLAFRTLMYFFADILSMKDC